MEETYDDFKPIYDGLLKKDTNNLVYQRWAAIRDFSTRGKVSRVYNIKVINNSIADTLQRENVMNMFNEQQYKFKINASLGYILYNNVENQLKYWHASPGVDTVFKKPELISDKIEFESFMESFTNQDIIELVTSNRENTSWTMHCLTNITFYITPILYHSIGGPISIPLHIKNHKSIKSNDKNTYGKPYNDNLCLFRCLAINRKQDESFTKRYFKKYLLARRLNIKKFQGIDLSDLPFFERLFQVSVSVYTLVNIGQVYSATLLSRSSVSYNEKIYLHLEGNHFCLITDIKNYTNSYKCIYCSKLFTHRYEMTQHMLGCSTETKFIYPWGEYKVSDTIFDRLASFGINVPQHMQCYPYFAVYDCETYQKTSDLPLDTPTMSWCGKHVLASISICSNIPGFSDPLTFVNDNDNESELVEKMLRYLLELSEVSKTILMSEYKTVFDEILIKKEECLQREKLALDESEALNKVENSFKFLVDALNEYLSDLIVFGFASKGFDIPVMREHMISYFHSNGTPIKSCIKRQGKYMMLSTNELRFLDISNYLATATTLSQYLNAMEIEVGKFFWPHEMFTSMDILKQTTFPKRSDFHNSLKNTDISERDYQYCKEVWNVRGMKTLRDMLVYYNECDVKPLCLAIEKHYAFFKERNLDFKSALSLSGMATRYLFQLKDPEHHIYLFGNKHSDLYHLMRSQIRGGLSMVYNRYQEQGKTRVRPEGETTQICEGWDVSSMYLSNLTMQAMPTGRFVRRRCENGFKVE